MQESKPAELERRAKFHVSSVKKHDISYYVKAVIGILIMVLFPLLPAPAPITTAGMAVLGQMIGLIFLWTFVDMMWPTFAAIVLFGLQALNIYPNSWQTAGIYEAGQQSFGNWIVLFALGCLILCVALEECGIIRRITMWFITRKAAKRNPWVFSFMLLLSTMLVGLFLDCVAAQFFMLGIAHEVFELMGFKKGDKWPKYMVVAMTFTIILSFAMTPICHTASILFMGVYSGITGQTANILGYMMVGIPIGLIIWVLMLLWFRFIVKPDVSQFEQVDFSVLEEKRPGPMGGKEKLVSIVCVLLLISWLLPGFLSFLAPQSQLFLVMDRLTATTPLFVVIVFLSIIRVDGTPVLELNKALKKLDWLSVVFLAGILMIATAAGEATTGIPDFIATYIAPMASGLSPFALAAIIAVISCVLTNVANNIPVGIILVNVSIPLAQAAGVNPFLLVIAICVGANMAYTIPPAFVPVGIAYADEWCEGKAVLKNGLVMTAISCAILALLIYPLGTLILGN